MKNGIVINHNIPLTTKLREQLLSEPHPVDVIGYSVPVWIDDGDNEKTTSEVFCKYSISSYRVSANMIMPDNEGYIINIGIEDDLNNLKDVIKGGNKQIWLNERTTIEYGSEKYTAIHQIHIFDVSYLEESLTFMHLD